MKEAKIRVLIVDDEPLARKFIRRMLKHDQEIEIVGECGNGKDAVTMIARQNPDLVFLDVQMPEMDGFSVLEAVGVERLPLQQPTSNMRFGPSNFTRSIIC